MGEPFSVFAVIASVSNVVTNFFLDQIHIEQGVELHQFVQPFEGFRRVLEGEG